MESRLVLNISLQFLKKILCGCMYTGICGGRKWVLDCHFLPIPEAGSFS